MNKKECKHDEAYVTAMAQEDDLIFVIVQCDDCEQKFALKVAELKIFERPESTR